jgi:hypothetical protein
MGQAVTIMSKEEAMAQPLKKRPIAHRISSEIYHAVWEHIGAASGCYDPQPAEGTFKPEHASQVAVKMCFAIAEEIERREREVWGLAAQIAAHPDNLSFLGGASGTQRQIVKSLITAAEKRLR